MTRTIIILALWAVGAGVVGFIATKGIANIAHTAWEYSQ